MVDVKRCKMYLDNFGEFFEDQIEHADIVLLSRTEKFPDKVDDAQKVVCGVNAHAQILSKPWDGIDTKELFYPHTHKHEHACGHEHDCGCACHSDGGAHDHDHCECGHDHTAEEIFDTITIHTQQIYSEEDLKARMEKLERNTDGMLLRAKGIVKSENGYWNLQYLPGDIQISKTEVHGDVLCFIGRNLDEQTLNRFFNGE